MNVKKYVAEWRTKSKTVYTLKCMLNKYIRKRSEPATEKATARQAKTEKKMPTSKNRLDKHRETPSEKKGGVVYVSSDSPKRWLEELNNMVRMCDVLRIPPTTLLQTIYSNFSFLRNICFGG